MSNDIQPDAQARPHTETEKPGPQKLWNPEDAIQPVVDLFNQGKIAQGTASLKMVEEAAKGQEPGAWRHEIEVLNSKVDLSKLNLVGAGQIFGVDDKGNLLTVDSKLGTGQVRSPENPSAVKENFPLVQVTGWGEYVSFDMDAAEQVQRVSQYKRDVVAGKEMAIKPEQMQVRDDVTPIIADFNSGKYADAVSKIKALQTADSTLEPQQWLRHIEAINCNLNLEKLGLKDVSQIIGVDDKGTLITASADLSKVQSRNPANPTAIIAEQSLVPDSSAYFSFGSSFGSDAGTLPDTEPMESVMPLHDLKKTGEQIKTVEEIKKEAEEARLPHLGPGMHHLSVTVDGEQREYDEYVGNTVAKGQAAKTYYLFHGAGPPPERGIMEKETNANKFADETGSIIIYPFAEEHRQPVGKLTEGLWFGPIVKTLVTGPEMDYHAWNSPGAALNETRTSYDDIHYTQAIDANVSRQTNAGPRYLIGFSEGAEFARHVAPFINNVAGVGMIHPADTNTESTLQSPAAMVEVTSWQDGVLNRAGGSTYKSIAGNFEARWPRMALSDPTRPFYLFAQVNGCSGEPHVEKTAEQILTKYTADQCTSGRPVMDVDRIYGEHAIDGPEVMDWGGWFAGQIMGRKDKSFDSFRFIANTLSQYE